MNMNIPNMPEEWKDPATWPEEVRREWSDDKGAASAVRHRDELIADFRVVRDALDEFNPDLVVMFGDDQYENFQEDVVPPFCIFAYENFEPKPFGVVNYWGESHETVMPIPGHPTAGKYLASRLIEDHFDMAYAYKPLHHPMGHAFVNGVLFLDWDRKGWNYPLLPIQVNNYGRRVIQNHGGMPKDARYVPTEAELDPPSPMPGRCFELGGAIVRAMQNSPWRTAIIASSSWSHGFLTAKNHYLWPGVDTDMKLYDAMVKGQWDYWRDYPLAAIEDNGDQETLNWFCLIGAMAELNRKPDWTNFHEGWLFNSPKAFAVFKP
jgi:hypothetical protein